MGQRVRRMIQVYSKVLSLGLFLEGLSIHVASPFLFFKLGFESVLWLTLRPLTIMLHLGNRLVIFQSGHFTDFLERC